MPDFYITIAENIFSGIFFGGWGWEWGRATPSPGLPPAKSGPDAQNLLPKICTKSPISRLIWKIDGIGLALLGGFRGWPTFGLGAEI